MRLAIVLVLGAALFAAAVSNEVYEMTSPFWLSWHVLLRKLYSVAAFATLAALAVPLWTGRRTLWRVTALLAGYSAAIEVGQWLHGAREGLALNLLDVACGAAGGVAGFFVARAFRPKAPRTPSR